MRASIAIVGVISLLIAGAGCSQGSAAVGSASTQPKVRVLNNIKAPNALPLIMDGTSPSPDRVTMNRLLGRAAQENKSIILEVGAAWCGPCTDFASDINGHPEYLSELAASGYILVKADSERVVNGGGLEFLNVNDFLPTFINFFPSFYLYTDSQGWQGIGPHSSYADLKQALQNTAGQAPLTLNEIKNYIESNASIGADSAAKAVASQRITNLVYGNMPGNYRYAEANSIIGLMLSESANFPKLDLTNIAASIKAYYLPIYLGVGAVDLATLNEDYPDVVPTLLDVSNDNFSISPYFFGLSQLWREKGLKQAVSQCVSSWQTYRNQLVPGTLSASDFQEKLASYDLTVKITCADLELRSTGPTAALKAKVASMDQSAIKDWYLIAGLGQIDKAVDIYHAHFQQYVEWYGQDVTALNAKLQTATSNGDQAKVDQINKALQLDNFRTRYHTKLDSDVENALRAGQPVHVLEVLN